MQIERTGKINLGTASLSVVEEGSYNVRDYQVQKAWEHEYKNQVFKRIVWMMRNIGWTCTMPEVDQHAKKQYGYGIAEESARRKRFCQKGDLKADLEMTGCSITLKFFQSINTPDRADHEGRYQSDLEKHMTYLMRLEMQRTRNRITQYLCNVFTGYQLNPEHFGPLVVGPTGMTALEWKDHNTRKSGHYVAELGHARIHSKSNATARDGGTIEHGATVWYKDWATKRIFQGTAYYDLNTAWYLVSGKYGHSVVHTHEIYANQPANLRDRLSHDYREKRLNNEMNKAIKEMRFERAAQLRDILFPKVEPLFMLYHTGHNLYHRACFSGYSNNTHDAGKFTRAQLDDFIGKDVTEDHLNRVVAMTDLA
jgi:hypothetical protein